MQFWACVHALGVESKFVRRGIFGSKYDFLMILNILFLLNKYFFMNYEENYCKYFISKLILHSEDESSNFLKVIQEG